MNDVFVDLELADEILEKIIDETYDIAVNLYYSKRLNQICTNTHIIDENPSNLPEKYYSAYCDIVKGFYALLDKKFYIGYRCIFLYRQNTTVSDVNEVNYEIKKEIKKYEENNNFSFKDYLKYKMGIEKYQHMIGYEMMEKLSEDI